MALSKDWREFLELLNSRGVDYVIVSALIPSRGDGEGPHNVIGGTRAKRRAQSAGVILHFVQDDGSHESTES